MKKLVLFALVLAMTLSMVGCGCDHEAGEAVVKDVDTANLKIQWDVPCSKCGKVMESKETSTGDTPLNGVMALSADEWFACLSTNIRNYGAEKVLMPIEAEAQDDTLLLSVIGISGLKSVLSFHDADGNAITPERRGERSVVKSIHVQAQFTNESATDFYKFLLATAITCNNELDMTTANELCSAVMSCNMVSNNGYSYVMGITSVEDHTVQVIISVE